MNNLYVVESSLESSNDSKKNSKYTGKKQNRSLKVDNNNNNIVPQDQMPSPTDSDSDSDSETDSDESDSYKIHVKINPVSDTINTTTSDVVLSQIGITFLYLDPINS